MLPYKSPLRAVGKPAANGSRKVSCRRQGGNMQPDLTQAERRRPRIAQAQCMAPRWLAMAGLLLAATALPAVAVELGPLTKVSGGDPFAGCTADQRRRAARDLSISRTPRSSPGSPPTRQTEQRHRRLAAGPLVRWRLARADRWAQQERRRRLAERHAGPGHHVRGRPWKRASDPWLDFSTKGVAYFMHLAFEPDLPSGAFGQRHARDPVDRRRRDLGQPSR